MTTYHDCAGQVFGTYGDYPCSRRGALEEDGKWWCRTHAPSAVAARRAKSQAKYTAERAEIDALSARADALGVRAGAQVGVSWFLGKRSPTKVEITAEALDRLLTEAGR